MDKREQEIGELVNYLPQKSKGFTKPKLIVIGGYALRAFVPFSRYSRDCDFVLKEGLDQVNKWPPLKEDSLTALLSQRGQSMLKPLIAFFVAENAAIHDSPL